MCRSTVEHATVSALYEAIAPRGIDRKADFGNVSTSELQSLIE